MSLVATYQDYADQMADKYGLNRDLFRSVIKQESGWNPNATSSKGAFGLGQLTPGTAHDLGVDMHNWRENLEGSAKYLADQIKRFGRVDLGLSAYNSGPGGSEKNGQVEKNSETRNYVDSILDSLRNKGLDVAVDLIPGLGSVGLDGSDIVDEGVKDVKKASGNVGDFLWNFFSHDTLVRTVVIIIGIIFVLIAVITFLSQSQTVQEVTKSVTKAATTVAAVAV